MQKKTFDLLCNVGELTGIFQNSTNIQGLLHLVVKVIARHMETEACAIFLLDKGGNHLILRAAVGFNPEAIGKLKLEIGEGITGTSLKQLKPICVPKGSEDPNFKYVPGILEEKYESFLAVPILHTSKKLGVIILEDSRADYYSQRDIRALSTIASQLANFLENAKMLMELRKADGHTEKSEEKPKKGQGKRKSYYNGKASSPGIAMGRTVTISDADEALFMQLNSNLYYKDIDSFETSVEKTKRQLEEIQAHMDEKLSEAGSLIFGSHLLMLSDTDFTGSMRSLINKGLSAPEAVVEVVNDYVKLFLQNENVYVQEKIHDVKDLGHRLLMNLSGESMEDGDYTGQIVIAKNLLPSELVKLSAQNVEGFVIYGSGVTSHVSILARSLNVPSVLLTEENLFVGDPGTFLILDGYQGAVILDPEEEVIEKYANLQEEMETRNSATEESAQPEITCVTSDGSRVELLSNINLLSDVRSARKAGTGGVGLYRSEYLFLVRNDFVSEEEQQIIYRRILSEMEPVFFRTMDIGGDKKVSASMDLEEENPVMGLRASRYALKHPDIFRTQIRALLQAGVGRKLNILFPLIYGVEEFFKVKHFITQVMEELKKEGLPYNGSPKYGAMIELPSAAVTAGVIARHADFISIGTNDLVQYLLGVDRANESVEDIYNIYHPSVLRTLENIAKAAQSEKCPLSVCGDSAGDETMLMFYIGIGIRSFSVDSRMLNTVRSFISTIDTKKAEEKARRMLRAETADDVLH